MEQAVAGPFCSNRLRLAGARVIKIERYDGGDFARGYDTPPVSRAPATLLIASASSILFSLDKKINDARVPVVGIRGLKP